MCEIAGSVVIVKFFTNSVENCNSLITRTLKKIGVVDREYISGNNSPANGELWKVKIIREICENQNKGCFILDPLELVDPQTVVKLVPGMYEEKVIHKVLCILPKSPFDTYNCIIPLDFKRKLSSYRAILVKLKEGIEDLKMR